MEGGRRVDYKCVQHWFWRPTYPTTGYTPHTPPLKTIADASSYPGKEENTRIKTTADVCLDQAFSKKRSRMAAKENTSEDSDSEQRPMKGYCGMDGGRQIRATRTRGNPTYTVRGSSSSSPSSSSSSPPSGNKRLSIFLDNVPMKASYTTSAPSAETFRRSRGQVQTKNLMIKCVCQHFTSLYLPP